MWGSRKEKSQTDPRPDWEKESEARRLKKLEPLIALCRTRAQDIANILRAELALSGHPLTTSGEELFFEDVFAVVVNFARANGKLSGPLGRILLDVGTANSNGRPISKDMDGVRQSLKGKAEWVVYQFWSSYSKDNATLIEQAPEVIVPRSVEVLSVFDQRNGTDHAGEGARVFLDFASVVRAEGDRQNQESLDFVLSEYARLLTPYFATVRDIPGLEDDLKRSLDEMRSIVDDASQCADCLAAYQVLGLKNGATRDDIQAAYRDYAKMYHPDRFPESDQRLRERAEAEFKKVQQAHTHIVEHRRD